jgi:deoxycytidylate deaminase
VEQQVGTGAVETLVAIMLIEDQIDKAVKASYQLFEVCYRNDKNRNKYKTSRKYHFAFIFRRKKIISVGINSPHSYDSMTKYFGYRYKIPKYQEYCHAHAEIDAISQCWGRTILDSSYTLIVMRINSIGRLCDSKPCDRCQPVLDRIGLKDVWWSNSQQAFCNGLDTITHHVTMIPPLSTPQKT